MRVRRQGGDGEPWCTQAGAFLRNAEVTFHLDPWRVGHAIGGALADPALAGDVDGAIAMLKQRAVADPARAGKIGAVVTYLRNNRDAIRREESMSEERRERRVLASLQEEVVTASKVVESEGKGYLPPHQVDTRDIGKGKAYALYAGMAAINRED